MHTLPALSLTLSPASTHFLSAQDVSTVVKRLGLRQLIRLEANQRLAAGLITA